MSESTQLEFLLFEALQGLPEPERREALLEWIGGRDPQLRREVEALLAVRREAEAYFAVSPTGGRSITELLGQLESAAAASPPPVGATVGPATVPERPPPAGTPPEGENPGEWIGAYRLERQIGEGGCGVVYLARQAAPVRRFVALKIIKPGMDTRQVVARFAAERQALALMDHPNITRVLDAGTTASGRAFFVMEWVEGHRITTYCDQRRLSTDQRLELFLQVCQAVQHAHQKGIIHRDLKPSNILVTEQDGQPVPKVIDFGIAKALEGRLTEATLITATAQFLGTPAYVSPEQAVNSGATDTRSDIYSLGVLLYELLTGRTPFDTHALMDRGLDTLRRTILNDRPPRPSARLGALPASDLCSTAQLRSVAPGQLVAQVRGDLDCIVMRCLEKDLARRYATANALAMDVQRSRHHEPIVARAPSQTYLLRRMIRRHRGWFIAGGLAALGLLAGLGMSTWMYLREAAARERAEAAERSRAGAQETAQRERAKAEHLLARQKVATGWSLLDQGNYWQAMTAFADARRLDAANPDHAPTHHLRLASVRSLQPRLEAIASVGSHVVAACLSPDERRLALATLDASGEAAARVWDLQAGGPLSPPMCHPARLNTIAFSRDGQRLVTAGEDGVVRIWNVATAQPASPGLPHGQPVHLARFSPDGTKVLTACSSGPWSTNGTVTLWDCHDGTPRWQHKLFNLNLRVAEFTPDGRHALLGSFSYRACLADAATGEVSVLPQCWRMWCDAFNPAGTLLLVGGAFGENAEEPGARLLNPTTREYVAPRLPHAEDVLSVAFSPGEEWIATGSADRTARVWRRESGQPVTPPLLHDSSVVAVQFSMDGRRLLTVAADRTVHLWELPGGRSLLVPLPHAEAVILAWFSPEADRVHTLSRDGSLCTWSVAPQLVPRWRLPHLAPPVRSCGPGPEGSLLTTDEAELRCWDPATGRLQQVFDCVLGSGDRTVNVVGQFILAASAHEAMVFDATARRPTVHIAAPLSKPIRTAQLSADGKRLAVLTARASEVREVDTQSGRTVGRYVSDVPLLAATYAPDGRQLLSADEDGTLSLWDTGSGQVVRRLPGTAGSAELATLLFSPDQRRLLVVDEAAAAQLLDGTSFTTLSPSLTFTYNLRTASFSPDGRWIASANRDGPVRVYDATTGLLATAPLRQTQPVLQARFSPDGQWIATASLDRTARIWEASTGEPVTPPLPHQGPVADAGFSPDGRMLYTAGHDGFAYVWDLPLDPDLAEGPHLPADSSSPAGRPGFEWDRAEAFRQTVAASKARHLTGSRPSPTPSP